MTFEVSLQLSCPDRHRYMCLFVCSRERTELVLDFQPEAGRAVPGKLQGCDSFDQVPRSFRNFGLALSRRALPAIVCSLKQISGYWVIWLHN